MTLSALIKPVTDPTRIFEHFRNGYATDLLAVAAADFDVFGRLARGPKSFDALRAEIGLADPAANGALGDAKALLHVGGGTGIYAIACVQQNPELRAAVWDRPEVLKVAREMVDAYGVADRVELVPGDMFADPVPAGADAILL